MAKVLLKKPRSYRVNGISFKKGEAQVVSDDWARENLVNERGDPLDNFDIVYAEDIERMAAHGVRTAIRRPPTEEQRTDQIIKAAEGLSPNNPAHYTKTGKPQTAALTELLGWVVSADDRNQAFPDKPKQEDKPSEKMSKGKVETTENADIGGAKIKITRRTKVDDEKGDLSQADLKHLTGKGGQPLDTGEKEAAKAAKESATDADGGVEV